MNPLKQYFALTKALLKINFSTSYWKANLKKGISSKLIGQGLITLLVIVVAVVYEGLYIMLLRSLYPKLAMVGQQSSLLTMGIAMSQIMVLIFGMFYVLAAFYYAKGTAQLMAMPMTPATVMMSKFSVVLVNEYLTEAAILAPIMGIYGIMSGAGAGYWIMCVLVFLMAPLLPLALSSLMAMLLAGVIAKGRNKALVNFIGILLFMAAYFGFQYFSLFKLPQDESSILQYVATINYKLALAASKNFPPSLWATIAISEGFKAAGLRFLAMFAAASAFGLAAMGLAGSRFYYGVIMTGGETGTNKRKGNGTDYLSKLVMRDPKETIASKDHKVVIRTSVYLMNCGVLPIIWPGLILMYSMFGKNMAAGQPEDQLIQFLMSVNFPWLKTIAFMLLTLVVSTGNMIASTSFSREGRSLGITKALPISGRHVILAKVRYALMFQLVTSLPMVIILQYLFRLTPAYLTIALLIGQIGGLWSIFGGMLLDLMRPYLNWTDPTRAVKQNINAVVPMFVGWGLIFAQGYAVYRMMLAGWSGWLPIGLVSGFNVMLAVVTFAALMAFADKGYDRIEM